MPELVHHKLDIDGCSNELRVLSFDGYEGLSQLFQFSISIACDTQVSFDDVIGKKATLSIQVTPDEPVRYVHGIISRFEELDPGRRFTVYRATLVPAAWKLQHRHDARIFQELAVPAIVKKVLDGAGLNSGDDYKISLQGTYAAREYCVQYRESDWDFVSRLLEEEGITYYFEQSDSKHVLCLIDTASAYPAIEGDGTLVYRPSEGALGILEHGTHVTRFLMAQEVRPGKVTLRDFNFKKPALLLESKNAGSKDADLEIYDYPGDYEVPGDGDTYAKTRLQELQATQKSGEGDSTCARFMPGHTFSLAEHPHEALNIQYMVTRVEHRGVEPQVDAPEDDDVQQTPYANAFEVTPASVLFRPPRVTRRPLIHGAQTAIVVGPGGEEIYTDEHGRVKVQFHWDRLGKNDDKSSCWMRVSQPWAGAGFGGIFIPRIGDEVVITFLEGDPDRPLIVGRVYHGTNVPPYALPGEKTKSTIKTHSTPKGDEGASNEIRFEDKKGSEEIYVHGQKDWTIKIENDKNQKVVHDETLDVGNDRTKHVAHDQKATIDNDDTIEVKHDRKETIDNDETVEVKHDRTVTIDNDHTFTVKGKETYEVDKDQALTVKGKQSITVKDAVTIEVDADHTETLKAKATQKISGDRSVQVDGKSSEKVTGDATESYSGKLTISVTGDYATSVNGKTTISSSQDVAITCGAAKVTIKPSGEISIEGVQLAVKASGPLSVEGATVDVKATGQATVKGPMVNVAGDGMVKVKGGVVMLDGQVMAG